MARPSSRSGFTRSLGGMKYRVNLSTVAPNVEGESASGPVRPMVSWLSRDARGRSLARDPVFRLRVLVAPSRTGQPLEKGSALILGHHEGPQNHLSRPLSGQRKSGRGLGWGLGGRRL